MRNGEFFSTAAGESHIAGKPGRLCWLEPCQSPGEESTSLRITPALPLQQWKSSCHCSNAHALFFRRGEECRTCLRMAVGDRQLRAGATVPEGLSLTPSLAPREGRSSQGTKLLLSHHSGEEATLVSSHTSVGDFLTGELATTSSSQCTPLPMLLKVLNFF